MKTFQGQGYIDFDAPAQQHSETSVAAAKGQTRTKKDGDRLRILQLLAEAGPLTDEEIGIRSGIGANTVRPRRVELVRDGLVQAVGEGRTVSGKRAVTWGMV